MINTNAKRNQRKIKYMFLFYGILLVKLLLMGLFSSDYQNEVFIPFVKVFLNGQNPYEYYYVHNIAQSFPYMPVMLLMETMGGMILKIFSINSPFLINFVFKIPLLLFDYLCYWYIKKMSLNNRNVLFLYSISPILIYSTYMHGQLDIIPTAFLVIAVYYLVSWKTNHNLLLFSIFLGIAIGTKTHILATIPILFFYIVRKRNYWLAIKTIISSLLIAGMLALPFWGKGMLYTVLFNKEQSVLMNVNIDYGTVSLILPIAVLSITYLKTYKLNYFNRELLISIISLLFSVFLVCVPPNAGWFIWIVPFVSLYFSYSTKSNKKTISIYMGFCSLYIVYFILFSRTNYVDLYFVNISLQFLKIDNIALRNIVFTAMVGSLGMTVFDIYSYGLASNSLFKRGNVPFAIGITGDSGSGKTRMFNTIANLFGNEKDLLYIEGDGDHKWERDNDNWKKFTALDPQANYLYRQANDIKLLKEGNSVNRVDYNHDYGKFTDEHRIKPRKYIVICGLHSLFLLQLRKELDLKIYMDTDENLRRYWKIERDLTKRGHTKNEIIDQIENRMHDVQKYIYPQKEYADIIISYFDPTLSDYLVEGHDVRLSVKITIDINTDIEKLLDVFRREDIKFEYRTTDDLKKQTVVFCSNGISSVKIDFDNLASSIIPQYEDMFTYDSKWSSGIEGIVQLFLLVVITEKMKG